MYLSSQDLLKSSSFHRISSYPSQVDISITEQCNQRCDYCWANKSSVKTLKFGLIKKAIDIFLNFPLKEQTVTFTTGEPLVYPDLYKKTIDYILAKSDKKDIHVVTTTNGLLLNNSLRNFIINRISNKFRLNISLDGEEKSHNAHRKLRANSNISAFKLSWRNFSKLPRDKVRVIFTITPSEVDYLRRNIEFIINNGFRQLDLFPQMFTLWPEKGLKILKNELNMLIEHFNTTKKNDYDLRILNRLWGDSHYAKLLLGCDGNFYLFEWVLALPYSERKKYIIGDTEKGIDLDKRLFLFKNLFEEIAAKNYKTCKSCHYQRLCGHPIPLLIWCKYKKYNFSDYFNNFCLIAKTFIELSLKVKFNIQNELDILKLSRYL